MDSSRYIVKLVLDYYWREYIIIAKILTKLPHTLKYEYAYPGTMLKFCNKCKKQLSANSKYLLCEDCHKSIIFMEDDRAFYENSRLHY
jgi:hypothetical protein